MTRLTMRTALALLAVTAATALGPMAPAMEDDCPFVGARLYVDSSYPTHVMALDMENNGVMDLVTIGSNPNYVNVLQGDDSGRFFPVFDTWYSGYAYDAGQGDFDQDGFTDVIIAGEGLSLMINVGGGGFEQGAEYEFEEDVSDMTVGDVNLDGQPDVLTVSLWDDILTVHLGNGDGTLEGGHDVSLPYRCNGIALGDVNGDGKPDLALSSQTAGSAGPLTVLPGNGDGTFGAPQAFGEDDSYHIELGDLDGDGDLDAAVISPWQDVTVFEGDGSGGFTQSQQVYAGTDLRDLELGDIDGDGDLDVLVASDDLNSIIRLRNNGTGHFSGTRPIPISGSLTDFILEDVNGDDERDLVATSSTYGDLGGAAVLLNRGGGAFLAAQMFSGPDLDYRMVVEDFDLDGYPDAAVVNGDYNAELIILRGVGDGSFEEHTTYTGLDNELDAMAGGDFNGDGLPDLVVGGAIYDETASIYLGTGGGYFASPTSFDLPATPYYMRTASLNGDAADDLVIFHGGTGGNVVASYLGHASGTPQYAGEYLVGDNRYGLVTGDFNADGNVDAAAVTSTDRYQGAWAVLLGNGDGTFDGPQYATGSTTMWNGACGDLDNDGILDLVSSATHTVPYETWFFKGVGDGTFVLSEQFDNEYYGFDILIDDIDGDASNELLISDSDGLFVACCRYDTPGELTREALVTTGSAGHLQLSDLDRDGDPDLVQVADGRLWVLLNTAAGWSLATGPGPAEANPAVVKMFSTTANGMALGQWTAYGGGYGVNVALGNLRGDEGAEVLTGPGPGAVYGPHVRGFTLDGQPIPAVSFLAYGTNKYGVNVTAGDIDNDGLDEIVTGAGPGAVFGPHVRGWNWDGNGAVQSIPGISYFAYGTPKWGVNVGCGDLDNDGYDEIVTGAGPGAVYGPHVRGWNWDGGPLTPMGGVSFLAYGTNKYGVNVSCGDIDGDGYDEIVTGAGPGAVFGPQVRGWNVDGGAADDIPGINFFAYDVLHWGANVSCGDVDGDGIDEIITGRGPGAGYEAQVRGWNYDGVQLQAIPAIDFNAFGSGSTHGVNVAAYRD